MSNNFQISESELEVMKLLWESSPLSANEIISSLSDRMNWSHQTIKTFINRLLNKQVISFEKSGRSYLYYPLVSYDQYVKSENKSFLEKVYNGAVSMLFSKFLEDEKLSEKEIERLQKILEEKKSELEE
ncbi:penicillinase repressor BlaI [Gottschalkia acidurici 9a]|uniref:Penicillinase repressor BlaI n=1 Tax=Gottschalkia acidurici (strain ATCC 7906 / DSM 604 / BCRC 14475 / CIP 104303 / KCTC 5404 / NCIMB 10678 / 9a) TaxID=1128398 RepID=K0B567_GOTA9|nr:BlaI/MecI/CopY family transcriptional regulator [Gottschalkia acidurici]AFS79691.1 penicillinase repressor BlaI [Gottschalkia acidurici 9a]